MDFGCGLVVVVSQVLQIFRCGFLVVMVVGFLGFFLGGGCYILFCCVFFF